MWGFGVVFSRPCAYDDRMITVIIETRDDEVRLAHALAALVPAATEGVVRDVIVVDCGSSDGTLAVADAAGCTIVAGGAGFGSARRAAVEQARGDWLLFTSPATALGPNWQAEALAFVDRALISGKVRTAAGRFRRGRLMTGWRGRLLELRSRFLANSPDEGLLASKRAWLGFSAPSPAVSSASSVSGARRGAA